MSTDAAAKTPVTPPPAPAPLTIAAVQAESIPGDLRRNVRVAADWVRRAAGEGAEVVVLPETFLTGYDDAVFAGELPSLASDDWLAPLQDVVESTGTVALVSTALAEKGPAPTSAAGPDRRATISDLLLAPGMRPSAVYDKQHLYDSERSFFVPGDRGAVVTVGGARLALSICYDANFPEHAARAATAAPLAYVNSGAYFPGGEHRRDLHYASRALDNGMYVVFAGLVGAPHRFIGGSAVYDPYGRPVVRLGEEEGLAVATLDPLLVAEARASQRMWADRRDSLGELVQVEAGRVSAGA